MDYFTPWGYAPQKTKKKLNGRKKAERTKFKQALTQARQRAKERYS